MSEGVAEKILASIVSELEDKGVPRGWLERSIHEGLLSGFRYARDVRRVKRLMREDADRLYIHAKELCDWDIGDDGYTASEIRSIAHRLHGRYGLEIKSGGN